ncbi:uncharacterized protein LOC114531967 [Dendronephthya gigantea]|uniref:uncharacterized protein LOC114531967 n=2 Tax=Dendronephthya gigantea TaxID=151771 RepID=UPI00106AFF86|nr:uncharacterized protein LOC114531967 [Dendronephthya gigantea]
MGDEHTQASAISGINDHASENPVTLQEGNVLERDLENFVVVGSDPSVSNEDSEGPGRRPKTEEEMRECKYCEFKAKDWPEFAKHVYKIHHIKKVAEAYNIKLSKDHPFTYECDICSITCCGHQSFNAHMLGTKHRKALQLKAMGFEKSAGGGKLKSSRFPNTQNMKLYDRPEKSVKDKAIGSQIFANYPQPLIGLEYVTEVQVAGQNPRYECSLCDAKFEHDLKFPHLVGQKHRTNVLKIKRPGFVKELQPTTMKRSELTAALLKESLNLELAEGRQEVKVRVEKPPPGVRSPTEHAQLWGQSGRRGGAVGIRRGRGIVYSQRGSLNRRGTSNPRGRGYNLEQYNPHPPQGGSFGMNNSLDYGYGYFPQEPLNYNMPYNASYNNDPNFNTSFPQSSSFEEAYTESQPPMFSRGYSAPHQPPEQTPRRVETNISPKSSLSSGLASAFGDLTKLVKNDDDASVALQVSNALTQALLQYRMDDINRLESD